MVYKAISVEPQCAFIGDLSTPPKFARKALEGQRFQVQASNLVSVSLAIVSNISLILRHFSPNPGFSH